jgi:AcrR family transcriptional regulator
MPPKRGAPDAGANGARAGKPAQGRELRARGRRTLQRLLDAGVTVFARRGYHAARVDDIVKVARTSHGTFYLYFSNKEDLFRTLAENVASEMRELAESMPTMTAGDDGYDVLRVWLERFADVYEHYGPVIRAWTEAEIGGSEFGRMGTDVLAEFTRVLVGRISGACPPDVDPAVTAIALVAMIERFNYYVISRQVKVTRDQMLDTLTRAVHDSLFGARTIEPA